ncbi:MAG: FAD-binding oxidoreductase, partial [Acidobacteriia bacterium]|nr:FAD-binding oxidoreductase [Terriglobia bacterium]
GTIARSGGKVVKNVAGYDLQKLFTGSLGTLGIIAQATFRLHPCPQETLLLSLGAADVHDLARLARSLLDSTVVTSGIQARVQSQNQVFLDVRLEGLRATNESQAAQVRKAAQPWRLAEVETKAWPAREDLWKGTASAAVCKVSFLPAQLGELCSRLYGWTSPGKTHWQGALQAFGVGWLRFENETSDALMETIQATRKFLESTGGSLVVLRAPLELKARLDAWGDVGDALPLMRRVKEQFDPRGILSPGRFVGGI